MTSVIEKWYSFRGTLVSAPSNLFPSLFPIECGNMGVRDGPGHCLRPPEGFGLQSIHRPVIAPQRSVVDSRKLRFCFLVGIRMLNTAGALVFHDRVNRGSLLGHLLGILRNI